MPWNSEQLQSARRLPYEVNYTVGLTSTSEVVALVSLIHNQSQLFIIDTYPHIIQHIVFCLISISWNKPLSMSRHQFSLAARHEMPSTVLMAVERKNPIETQRRRSLGQLCESCSSRRAVV